MPNEYRGLSSQFLKILNMQTMKTWNENADTSNSIKWNKIYKTWHDDFDIFNPLKGVDILQKHEMKWKERPPPTHPSVSSYWLHP